MHLADRGGRDRLLVEVDERLLERQAELFLDHDTNLCEGEWAHIVLEAAQLGDDVRRDDVGPRGEQLAELDEGRPELVEHLSEMAAAVRADSGIGARLHARRPGKDVRQLVPLEEIAEAVPDGDLRNLRETADLARAWARDHG